MNTATESDLEKENSTKKLIQQARGTLRDARLMGFGLWDKATKETRQVMEQIKTRGAAKLSADSETSTQSNAGVSQRAAAVLERARAYGMASLEEAQETGHQLSDWLTKAFNDAGTAIEASEEQAISRLGRTLEQTNKTLNQLSKEVRESTLGLLDSAKQDGKALDYELRKALFGRQATLAGRIQAFWAALGLVSKQEMAEVNRKLVVLAESLENHLDEDSKNLVYLNRRKTDRRVKHLPVAFDKRLRDRREEDRQAS